MVAREFMLSHVAMEASITNGYDPNNPKEGKLKPGFMRLYSFCKPNLMANDYVIEVEQNIKAETDPVSTLRITNVRPKENEAKIAPQEFTVVFPRFSIDHKIINSYYPPDGHQDEGRILPHIVFNDPHYPWNIPAGTISKSMEGPIIPAPGQEPRTMVPWVALLVFDVDELRFHKEELSYMQSLGLENFKTEVDLVNQASNGTFPMSVAQYMKKMPSDSRNRWENETSLKNDFDNILDPIDVIFPPKDLIRQVLGQPFANSTQPGIEGLKYLAHVRHANVENCPDSTRDQQGFFSVVISPRTGAIFEKDTDKRLLLKHPKTQICHLVTIEHLDATIADWNDNSRGRVGLVSLFSWTYTVMPPDPVNFIETVRHLTENQQMLRIEDSKLTQIEGMVAATQGSDNRAQVNNILAKRLRAGYTMSRWRTQTGEETAAFARGPLVPQLQPTNRPSVLDLPDCSNTSQAYQILDPETGVMDLTYSSAWQVGKVLAISDTNFSAALMRFRARVFATISSRTKMKVNGVRHTRRIVAGMSASISTLQSLSSSTELEPSRFRPSHTDRSVVLLKDAGAASLLQSNTESVIGFNASAGDVVFSDNNKTGPNNSDWAIIHDWLADKLFLGGIPAQYLLPETSYLPKESLRFFYIDDFWMDCLIDGALSITNHLDGDDDRVRREMKKMFNVYLREVIPDTKAKPQIPSYGFIIRSQLIKAMPDLKIEVTWSPQDPSRASDTRAAVCRWTKWDDQTLLALFDRPPEELKSIVLKQPQHQQRFSLGSAIKIDTSDKVIVNINPRRLFTAEPIPGGEWPSFDETDIGECFDIENRCMKLEQLATRFYKEIANPGEAGPVPLGPYNDLVRNSCEFGLELNDPIYYFEIHPPRNSGTPTFIPRDRQLWVKEPPPTQSQPERPPTFPNSKPKPLPPKIQPQPLPLGITLTSPSRQPKIQPLPSSIARLNNRPTSTTIQSRFDLLIYPDYKGPPKRYPQDKYDPADYLPTQNIYFYDLIFSIRKRISHSASTYDLLKIVLDLPVTPDNNNTTTTTDALLTPNYDGPGLRMLSNQRFIPFLYHDVPTAPLHIELIPRAAEDDYAIRLNDRKTRELGFRLAEANIAPVKVFSDVEIEGERFRQPRGKVVVTMTEYYRVDAAPEGVVALSTRYRVVKWEGRDDAELDDGVLP